MRTSTAERTDLDLFQTYLDDVTEIGPLLSHEEECALAEQVQRGRLEEEKPAGEQDQRVANEGQQAQASLVEHNLRWVVKIAKRYRGRGLDLEDLIQEGNEGLLRAARDYNGQTHFATYSFWWIRQAITRALSDQGRAIRIPQYQNTVVRRLQQAEHELRQEFLRDPSSLELAEVLNMSEESVCLLLDAVRPTLSLDLPKQDETKNMLDLLAAEDDLEEEILNDEFAQTIENALQHLPARRRFLIERYFGFGQHRPHTLEQLSRIEGISRERVRQLLSKGLGSLRTNPTLCAYVEVEVELEVAS